MITQIKCGIKVKTAWSVGIAQLIHHEVCGGGKNPETDRQCRFATDLRLFWLLSLLRVWRRWILGFPRIQNDSAEMGRVSVLTLFLKCDTRLSVMSWSHLLLISSICYTKTAVEHVEQSGWYRRFWPQTVYVRVAFCWILAITKWWMPRIMRNKVFTAWWNMYIYIYMCVCVCVCVCKYKYEYIYIYIYIYIRIYKHY